MKWRDLVSYAIFCFILAESQDEFYEKTKRLIEETYSANGNKRITLMTHSMGGPLTLVFLNRQTSDWKDKYLHQWIAMSGKSLKSN